MTLYTAVCAVETFTVFHCHVQTGKVSNAALQKQWAKPPTTGDR